MSEADELKALREEVAALREEVAELRATTPRVYIQGAPIAPGAFPYMPVTPLPMPPYPFQPYYEPNTAAPSPWRPAWEVTCAANNQALGMIRILGDPEASFEGRVGDGGTKV